MRFLQIILIAFVVASAASAAEPAGPERYVVKKDSAAYRHALHEAQIMASRGRVYHALGCAKGARYSGVGMSYSDKPRHCYLKMSTSRLIARAYVRTKSGATYWSAHYR